MVRSRCSSEMGAEVNSEFILSVRFRVWREHGQQWFFGLSFMLFLIQDIDYDRDNYSYFVSFLIVQCFLQHQYVLTYNCELLMNERTTKQTTKARKPMPIVLAEQLQLLRSSWTYMAFSQWKRKLGNSSEFFFQSNRLLFVKDKKRWSEMLFPW